MQPRSATSSRPIVGTSPVETWQSPQLLPDKAVCELWSEPKFWKVGWHVAHPPSNLSKAGALVTQKASPISPGKTIDSNNLLNFNAFMDPKPSSFAKDVKN